jgi:hypothetical protein
MRDTLSYHFENTEFPSKYFFFQSKSRTTDFVSYLDYIIQLTCLQGQFGAIYLDLSSAFDLVLHPLLHNLSAFGLSNAYVSCVVA